MKEELNQFQRNNVRTLVERSLENRVIRTKWVYRNKLDDMKLLLGIRQGKWHKGTYRKKA